MSSLDFLFQLHAVDFLSNTAMTICCVMKDQQFD